MICRKEVTRADAEKRHKGEPLVNCKAHSYPIMTVNMGGSGQLLFCAQCVLNMKDYSIIPKLEYFPELLRRAAAMFDEKRKAVEVGEKPKEYVEFAAAQSRITEQFQKHIEEEK
jgi:hypothetical protein